MNKEKWTQVIMRVSKVLQAYADTGIEIDDLPSPMALADELDELSHEMMAVNL